MVSGQMRTGGPFPSVRILSKELKINPNTAHKVVMHLVAAGLLETRPGVGTGVGGVPGGGKIERKQMLGHENKKQGREGEKNRLPSAGGVTSSSHDLKKINGRDTSRN